MRIKVTTLQLLVLLAAAQAGEKLPSYITKCASRERSRLNACALEQGRAVLAHLGSKGDRKYGLPPVDPFTLPLVETKNSGFNLNFVDLKISAEPPLSYKLDDVDLDLDGRHLKFSYSAPALSLRSKYQTDGRILLLPVKGEGESSTRIENYRAHYSADLQIVKNPSDGLDYTKLANATFDVDASRVSFNFTNLFNGDEQLGKATNDFLNENWKDVFEETKWSTAEATRQYLTATLQNFFDKVPFNDAFPA